jgi:hypothetical protein
LRQFTGCGLKSLGERLLDETRKLIAGAIGLHLSGMRKDGEPVPEPSFFEMVEVVENPPLADRRLRSSSQEDSE